MFKLYSDRKQDMATEWVVGIHWKAVTLRAPWNGVAAGTDVARSHAEQRGERLFMLTGDDGFDRGKRRQSHI